MILIRCLKKVKTTHVDEFVNSITLREVYYTLQCFRENSSTAACYFAVCKQ